MCTLVFNLNPAAGGRVNWSDLLVAPPAGEVHTCSIHGTLSVSFHASSCFFIHAFLSVMKTWVDAKVGLVAARSTTAFTRSPVLCYILPCSPEVAAVLCLGRSVCGRCFRLIVVLSL